MKTKHIHILVIALLGLTVLTCSSIVSGNLVTEERPVSGFHEIEINGGYEVTLIQSDRDYLELTAPEKYISYIETKVQNGRLIVEKSSDAPDFNYNNFRIKLESRNLDKIIVRGAVELQAPEPIQQGKFDLVVEGAASLDMEFRTQQFSLNVDGAASVDLTGEAREAIMIVNGAGSIDARDYEVSRMEIELNGAGSANVYATKLLKATVTGMGSIRYKGNPRVIKEESSIFGTVKPY